MELVRDPSCGPNGAERAAGPSGGASEAVWFLSRHVFSSLRAIDACLAACLSVCRTPPADAPESAAHRQRFVMQQLGAVGSAPYVGGLGTAAGVAAAGGASTVAVPSSAVAGASGGGAGGDMAKCVVVIGGAQIVHAELQIKIRKHPNAIHKTSVGPERAWLLPQIQDATNLLGEAHQWLQQALQLQQQLAPADDAAGGTGAVAWTPAFQHYLATRLDHTLDQLMLRLRRGRDCLLTPRKKTIDDHLGSDNMRALTPPLPGDIAVSFYVQADKLMLAVYHLVSRHNSVRFDSFLAETRLPRLATMLCCLTRSLRLARQTKDKLYWAVRAGAERPPWPPATPLLSQVASPLCESS